MRLFAHYTETYKLYSVILCLAVHRIEKALNKENLKHAE
jgi:hypothetical protein